MRTKPVDLLGEQVQIPVRRQIGNPEAIREGADNIQAAPPDGSSGAKDGDVSEAIHVNSLVLSR
jgi:hypothetical protein